MLKDLKFLVIAVSFLEYFIFASLLTVYPDRQIRLE